MNILNTQLQNRIYVQSFAKVRLLKIALKHVKDKEVFYLMLRGIGFHFNIHTKTAHIIKTDKVYIIDIVKNEKCIKYTSLV